MLRTRLTFWNCTILALILGAIGVAIYFTSRATLFHSLDTTLQNRAHLYAAQWRGLPSNRKYDYEDSNFSGIDLSRSVDPEAARREGIDPIQLHRMQATGEALRPMVLSGDGADMITSARKAWDMDGFRQARQGSQAFNDIEYQGISLRVLSMPLLGGGSKNAVLQIAVPLQWEEEQMKQLGRTLLIMLPVALGLMLLAGVILTRRALRPISYITLAAETIEATNLNAKLPVVGNDEFAHLSSTFNLMLDRLHTAFEERERVNARQRRFISDASHELKSPLTTILARAGIALGEREDAGRLVVQVESIKRAALLMNAILKDLLLLAASDEGNLPLRIERVAAKTILEDALASVDLSNHRVESISENALELSCDPLAITRVLVNLLQNAIIHTPPGGLIQIGVTPRGHGVELVVSDEGSGIPEEHLGQIFDRFNRVESSRDRESGGSGLGLAIAKAIVEAHKGTISIRSKLNSSTTVTIDLPGPPCQN